MATPWAADHANRPLAFLFGLCRRRQEDQGDNGKDSSNLFASVSILSIGLDSRKDSWEFCVRGSEKSGLEFGI